MDEEMLSKLDQRQKQLNARGRSELIREAIGLFIISDQPELARGLVEEFKTWRTELRGVGTNLNQVAYRLNANHPLSSQQIVETLDELSMTFKALTQEIKKMRNDFKI